MLVVGIGALVAIAAYSLLFGTVLQPENLWVRVTTRDGSPLQGLEIMVKSVSTTSLDILTKRTDEGGIAIFDVPEGEYSLEFVSSTFPEDFENPGKIFVKVQTGRVDKHIQLAIKSGLDRMVLLRVRAFMSGTEGEGPFPGLQVGVWRAGSSSTVADFGYETTDKSGWAELRIPAGDYIVGFNPDTFPDHDYNYPSKPLVSITKGTKEIVITVFHIE